MSVSNLGQANLNLAASPPASPFSIAQTFCSGGASSLPTTLPPGGTCFFSIAYSEKAPGTPTGTITFTDNASLSNLTSTSSGSNFTQSVPLSAFGAGAGPPSLPPTSVSISVSEAITVVDTDTASVPPVSTAVTLATIPIGLLVSVDGGTPQVAPATFRETPILGGRTGANIEFQKIAGGQIGAISKKIDPGRVLNLISFVDGLDDFVQGGVCGQNAEPDALASASDNASNPKVVVMMGGSKNLTTAQDLLHKASLALAMIGEY